MLQSRYLILYLWLIIVLAGCTVALDLHPPWQAYNLHLHKTEHRHHRSPISETVFITHTLIVTKFVPISIPVSTGMITVPLHLLAVQPLTKNSTISVTGAITTVVFTQACSVAQAIIRSGYSSAVVLAAVTRPMTAVVDAGTTSTVTFDPTTARTIYWSAPQNAPTSACSSATPWLWHQSLLLPQEAALPIVTALPLPATSACTVAQGSTFNVFSTVLAARGEWPDLIYLEDTLNQPALLVLKRAESCSSGAGCATLRTVCQGLFHEGTWQNWCTSICR